MQLLVSVTGYIIPVCITQVLLVSVSACGFNLFLKCEISQELMRVQKIQFKLWSVYYMMGLGANFTMREVASCANSYANCQYDIYQDTFST